MPRAWSSYGASLTLILAVAAPAAAATILDKSITIEIRGDGSVAERTQLAVRLDSPKDLGAWSPYPIFLDLNRKLVDLKAFATQPDGKVVKVGRRGLDTAEVTADFEIHSSSQVRTVEIPAVPVGSVFHLDYQVEEKPYFPAGRIHLGTHGDRIERLRVEIRGAPATPANTSWRWRLDGSKEGLTVEESPGRVLVTASGLPAVEPPEHSPESLGPVLRYAWGPQATWAGIGRWYGELVASVPHGTPALRKKAEEIAGKIAGRRQKIEALAAFARKDVRYVAVEVGIGGYRPAAPEDTLTRRWGDCKDKSVLLVDLLAAAGIEAYPALIRLAPKGRVDADFPSPNEFNHVVVAVPVAGLDPTPDDPVSDGFLFIDATETLGSAFWFPASVQDQEALVLRGDRSLLVHTAVRPAVESRSLEVTLAGTATGDAVGQAVLLVTGETGAAWVSRLATRRPEENEADARALLAAALPGTTLTSLGVKASREGVPSLRISARVQIPGFLPVSSGGGGGPVGGSFQPPSFRGLPAPGLLEGRTVPMVLTPEVTRSVWRLQLPEGSCPPAAQDAAVENDLGSFHQKVAMEGTLLTVERRAELKSRWIEPARFPALKELALAEYRAGKRLVRLDCGGKTSR
jgi:transglutaminase-like putative cysteine protease